MGCFKMNKENSFQEGLRTYQGHAAFDKLPCHAWMTPVHRENLALKSQDRPKSHYTGEGELVHTELQDLAERHQCHRFLLQMQ